MLGRGDGCGTCGVLLGPVACVLQLELQGDSAGPSKDALLVGLHIRQLVVLHGEQPLLYLGLVKEEPKATDGFS